MLVTLLGMVMEVREEQSEKAPYPILVRLEGRIILLNLSLDWKLTPVVFVIPSKSTHINEVIVSRMQVKSSLLRVPVMVSSQTNAGRVPISHIKSSNVPGTSTWRVNTVSLLIYEY